MDVVAVVSLIALLASKELASASGSDFSLRIAEFLNVGIFPLLLAFAVMVGITTAMALA